MHPFIPLTDDDKKSMLADLGLKSIEEIFHSVLPQKVRLKRDLKLPHPLSELEVRRLLTSKSQENFTNYINFLGAGVYDRFIPAVIDHIVSRPEFYTAYTPYQAEVSQGTLQAMYEFQSLICDLTGMEVANSSMYDGATALAEALLMALRINKGRNSIVLPYSLNPMYRQVVETYLSRQDIEIITVRVDQKTGQTDLEHLSKIVSDKTAAVVFQHPNFFGILEDPDRISDISHNAGALLIEVFDPISLGLLKPPGDYDVDIAVAEGQQLGLPLGYGGPYLGIFATKRKFVRQMPGRIIGMTVDTRGQRGFVMALQTREQHIRREKATSNICTNQALCALTALVYLSLLGKKGIKEVAAQTLQKTYYMREKLSQLPGIEFPYTGPVFQEFVVRFKEHTATEIRDKMLDHGILFGLPLELYGGSSGDLLIAVTEKRTRDEIDRVVSTLSELVI